MKTLLLTFAILLSSIGWSGPGNSGNSGGNPAFVNFKSGYTFKSPFPTAVNIKLKNWDIYEYGLQGYQLTIERLDGPTTACVPTNLHKTVCEDKFEPRKASGYVVFDNKTFRVIFTSQYDNQQMLEGLFYRLALDMVLLHSSK
ncbi:MAG: hypothetical protein AB7T49_14220 [Oligoflexales bacterium]